MIRRIALLAAITVAVTAASCHPQPIGAQAINYVVNPEKVAFKQIGGAVIPETRADAKGGDLYMRVEARFDQVGDGLCRPVPQVFVTNNEHFVLSTAFVVKDGGADPVADPFLPILTLRYEDAKRAVCLSDTRTKAVPAR